MRTGRPSKLTPELQADIVRIILHGNFREVAAKRSGISARTLHAWVKQGKEQKRGIYRDFLHAVLKAEATAETVMVRVVRTASRKDAKHAEWFLERKFPKRWGKKDQLSLKQSQTSKGEPATLVIENDSISATQDAKPETT